MAFRRMIPPKRKSGAHYNPQTRDMMKAVGLVSLPAIAVALIALAPALREVDWPFYGGDQGGSKFSPLTDVTAANVSRLSVAWEWKTAEKALETFGTRPGNFQATPIMIDNVLYFSTPYNRVVGLNATPAPSCGATIHKRTRMASRRTAPASSTAASPRGAT